MFELEQESFGCTCPIQYIAWIDQLNMDVGGCYKLSQSKYDIIENEVRKRLNDLQRLLPMFFLCGFGSKKSSFPSYERQISKELKRIRVGFTHDICTCTTDKCDASSAPNKILVTSKSPEESSDHDATLFTTVHEHITHTPMKGNETSASPKVQNSDMPPNNQPNNDPNNPPNQPNNNPNNLPDKDKESVTTMSGANRIVNYVSFYCIMLAEVIIRRIVNDFF